MFFLERRENVMKPIKDAAGLNNSGCAMPLYTHRWKAIAVCEDDKPLREYIGKLPSGKWCDYQVTSNEPEAEVRHETYRANV